MNSLFRRALCGALAVVYFTTQIAFASQPESTLWAERRRSHDNRVALLPSVPQIAPFLARSLVSEKLPPIGSKPLPPALKKIVDSIPFSRATLHDLYAVRGAERPAVVLIQDVHLNAEAQRNIAAMLLALFDRKAVQAVGVEGAFTAFDFVPLRALPDRRAARRTADVYLENRLMAAPSYAGVTSESEPPLMIGVDDRAHYQANVQSFLDSRAGAAELKRRLTSLKVRLDVKKKTVFSPVLRKFDDLRSGYRGGSIGLGVYVKRIAARFPEHDLVVDRFLSAFVLESSLDFPRIERERTAILEKLSKSLSERDLSSLLDQSLSYRAGELGFGDYYRGVKELCLRQKIDLRSSPAFDDYLRYIFLSDGINAPELFQAIERLERNSLAGLLPSKEELAIYRADDRLHLVSKLANFALTPEEWTAYRAGEKIKELAAALAPYERFYEEADARSRAMTERLLASGSNRMALVSGGFHAPAIAALLRKKNISYAIVSPKVTKTDAAGASAYLSIFAREKTPLERLFDGEKLFLNSTTVNFPESPRLKTLWIADGAMDGGLARAGVAEIHKPHLFVAEADGPDAGPVIDRTPLGRKIMTVAAAPARLLSSIPFLWVPVYRKIAAKAVATQSLGWRIAAGVAVFLGGFFEEAAIRLLFQQTAAAFLPLAGQIATVLILSLWFVFARHRRVLIGASPVYKRPSTSQKIFLFTSSLVLGLFFIGLSQHVLLAATIVGLAHGIYEVVARETGRVLSAGEATQKSDDEFIIIDLELVGNTFLISPDSYLQHFDQLRKKFLSAGKDVLSLGGIQARLVGSNLTGELPLAISVWKSDLTAFVRSLDIPYADFEAVEVLSNPKKHPPSEFVTVLEALPDDGALKSRMQGISAELFQKNFTARFTALLEKLPADQRANGMILRSRSNANWEVTLYFDAGRWSIRPDNQRVLAYLLLGPERKAEPPPEQSDELIPLTLEALGNTSIVMPALFLERFKENKAHESSVSVRRADLLSLAHSMGIPCLDVVVENNNETRPPNESISTLAKLLSLDDSVLKRRMGGTLPTFFIKDLTTHLYKWVKNTGGKSATFLQSRSDPGLKIALYRIDNAWGIETADEEKFAELLLGPEQNEFVSVESPFVQNRILQSVPAFRDSLSRFKESLEKSQGRKDVYHMGSLEIRCEIQPSGRVLLVRKADVPALMRAMGLPYVDWDSIDALPFLGEQPDPKSLRFLKNFRNEPSVEHRLVETGQTPFESGFLLPIAKLNEKFPPDRQKKGMILQSKSDPSRSVAIFLLGSEWSVQADDVKDFCDLVFGPEPVTNEPHHDQDNDFVLLTPELVKNNALQHSVGVGRALNELVRRLTSHANPENIYLVGGIEVRLVADPDPNTKVLRISVRPTDIRELVRSLGVPYADFSAIEGLPNSEPRPATEKLRDLSNLFNESGARLFTLNRKEKRVENIYANLFHENLILPISRLHSKLPVDQLQKGIILQDRSDPSRRIPLFFLGNRWALRPEDANAFLGLVLGSEQELQPLGEFVPVTPESVADRTLRPVSSFGRSLFLFLTELKREQGERNVYQVGSVKVRVDKVPASDKMSASVQKAEVPAFVRAMGYLYADWEDIDVFPNTQNQPERIDLRLLNNLRLEKREARRLKGFEPGQIRRHFIAPITKLNQTLPPDQQKQGVILQSKKDPARRVALFFLDGEWAVRVEDINNLMDVVFGPEQVSNAPGDESEVSPFSESEKKSLLVINGVAIADRCFSSAASLSRRLGNVIQKLEQRDGQRMYYQVGSIPIQVLSAPNVKVIALRPADLREFLHLVGIIYADLDSIGVKKNELPLPKGLGQVDISILKKIKSGIEHYHLDELSRPLTNILLKLRSTLPPADQNRGMILVDPSNPERPIPLFWNGGVWMIGPDDVFYFSRLFGVSKKVDKALTEKTDMESLVGDQLILPIRPVSTGIGKYFRAAPTRNRSLTEKFLPLLPARPLPGSVEHRVKTPASDGGKDIEFTVYWVDDRVGWGVRQEALPEISRLIGHALAKSKSTKGSASDDKKPKVKKEVQAAIDFFNRMKVWDVVRDLSATPTEIYPALVALLALENGDQKKVGDELKKHVRAFLLNLREGAEGTGGHLTPPSPANFLENLMAFLQTRRALEGPEQEVLINALLRLGFEKLSNPATMNKARADLFEVAERIKLQYNLQVEFMNRLEAEVDALIDNILKFQPDHLKTELKPHQRVASWRARNAHKNRESPDEMEHFYGFGFFDDTRLGKTLEFFGALDPAERNGLLASAVVLDTWNEQAARHVKSAADGGFEFVLVRGTPEEKAAILKKYKGNKRVLVAAGIDDYWRWTPEMQSDFYGGMKVLGVDEAQTVQNLRKRADEEDASGSKRARAVNAMPVQEKWFLSATPFTSKPRQLFAFFHMIFKNPVTSEFLNLVFATYQAFVDFIADNPKLLHSAIVRSGIRRLKSEFGAMYSAKKVHDPIPYELSVPPSRLIVRIIRNLGDYLPIYNRHVPEKARRQKPDSMTKMQLLEWAQTLPSEMGENGISTGFLEAADDVIRPRLEKKEPGIVAARNRAIVAKLVERYQSLGFKVARIDGAVTGFALYPDGSRIRVSYLENGNIRHDPNGKEITAQAYQRRLFQGEVEGETGWDLIVMNEEAGLGLCLDRANWVLFAQMPENYVKFHQTSERALGFNPGGPLAPQKQVDVFFLAAAFSENFKSTLDAELKKLPEGEELERFSKWKKEGYPTPAQLAHRALMQIQKPEFHLVMDNFPNDRKEGDSALERVWHSLPHGADKREKAGKATDNVIKAASAFLPLWNNIRGLDSTEEAKGPLYNQLYDIIDKFSKTRLNARPLLDVFAHHLRGPAKFDFKDFPLLLALLDLDNKAQRKQVLAALPDIYRQVWAAGYKGLADVAARAPEPLRRALADTLTEAPGFYVALLGVSQAWRAPPLAHASHQTTELDNGSATVARHVSRILDDDQDEANRSAAMLRVMSAFINLIDMKDASYLDFLHHHDALLSDFEVSSGAFENWLEGVVALKESSPEGYKSYLALRATSFPELRAQLSEKRVDAMIAEMEMPSSPELRTRLIELDERWAEIKGSDLKFSGLDPPLRILGKLKSGGKEYAAHLALFREYMRRAIAGDGEREEWVRGMREPREREIDYLANRPAFWTEFREERVVSFGMVRIDPPEQRKLLGAAVKTLLDLLSVESAGKRTLRLEEGSPVRDALTFSDDPATNDAQFAELQAYLSLSDAERSALKRNLSENKKELEARVKLRAIVAIEKLIQLTAKLPLVQSSNAEDREKIERTLEDLLATFAEFNLWNEESLGDLRAHLVELEDSLSRETSTVEYPDVTVEITKAPAALMRRGTLHSLLLNCVGLNGSVSRIATLVDDLVSKNKMLAIVRSKGDIVAVTRVKVRTDGERPVLDVNFPTFMGVSAFERQVIEALERTIFVHDAFNDTAVSVDKRRTQIEEGTPAQIWTTGAVGPTEFHKAIFAIRRGADNVYHEALMVRLPTPPATPELKAASEFYRRAGDAESERRMLLDVAASTRLSLEIGRVHSASQIGTETIVYHVIIGHDVGEAIRQAVVMAAKLDAVGDKSIRIGFAVEDARVRAELARVFAAKAAAGRVHVIPWTRQTTMAGLQSESEGAVGKDIVARARFWVFLPGGINLASDFLNGTGSPERYHFFAYEALMAVAVEIQSSHLSDFGRISQIMLKNA